MPTLTFFYLTIGLCMLAFIAQSVFVYISYIQSKYDKENTERVKSRLQDIVDRGKEE